VAVAALTDDRHIGRLYELTGPRSLTFDRVAAELSAAIGREIRYVPVSLEQHAAEAAEQGVPAEMIELLTYLFSEVVDGRNAPPRTVSGRRSAASLGTSPTTPGAPRRRASGTRPPLPPEPRDRAQSPTSSIDAVTLVGHDIGPLLPNRLSGVARLDWAEEARCPAT
jgi:hypothetical protein